MARKATARHSPQAQPRPAASDGAGPLPTPTPSLTFVGPDLPAAEVAQVLQRRARAMAQVPPPEEAGATIPVVVFALGQELYGVEAAHVQNIYPLGELTPVPYTPDYVAGVVNVRGRILSVVDLRRFLGLERTAVEEGTEVIAVTAAGLEVGILASEVRAVSPLRLDALRPALPTATRVAADYTRGVTADMLVLLDLEALLSDHRMVVYEEV